MSHPRVTPYPEDGYVVVELPGEEPLALTAGQALALENPELVDRIVRAASHCPIEFVPAGLGA